MSVVFYLSVFICLGVLLFLVNKNCSLTGKNNIKSYGSNTESVPALLDRIEWSVYYPGRNNVYYRKLFYSIILTLLISSFLTKEFPSPFVFLQTVFVVFVVLFALHKYETHHFDKFRDYAIQRNIEIIRKKVGCKRSKVKPYKGKDILGKESSCCNFRYEYLP